MFFYSSSVYSCHLFLISSASVRSILSLPFIVLIFAWNVPVVSLIFLTRSLVLPFYFFLNIVLVLPFINMNPPRVYTCSPSWTHHPPSSLYHPSGSSQGTSPKHPVSCIKPGLVICFLYDIIHVSIFLYFLAVITEEGYLSLLFFGTLHSNGYIFPFLLCVSLLFFHSYF